MGDIIVLWELTVLGEQIPRYPVRQGHTTILLGKTNVSYVLQGISAKQIRQITKAAHVPPGEKPVDWPESSLAFKHSVGTLPVR